MHNIVFLFPSEPFNKSKIDDSYAHEYNVANENFPTLIVDLETLEDGAKFNNSLVDFANSTIIYRGWMLKPNHYEKLQEALEKHNINMLTSTQNYLISHYISYWYPKLENFTMKTHFAMEKDIETLAHFFQGGKVFVKDFVKSLTTTEGSVASSFEELKHKIAKIKETRGDIEGGLALREFVELIHENEERYFIYNGKAFAREGQVPDIVNNIVQIHNAPFYSVDIAKLKTGADILIEVGDGQVSDIKKWDVEKFYQIFK